jgi:DNA-binding transcriptional LysR family regulator
MPIGSFIDTGGASLIDIRQLRYFVAVAEDLHFGRAADRLHISQPPLSRQIAALEAALGARLLERNARKVSLTRSGRRFLDDARVVLASFDEACRNAKLAEQGELGELAIGFMMHAAYTVLPGLVRRYVTAHPDVNLQLREVAPGPLLGDLLAGRFDAAILFDPGYVRGVLKREIYREPLDLAVPPQHPLALRGRICITDLDGEPLIATARDAAPTLHAKIDEWCRSAGFAPTIRLEAQLQQTILRLVAEGLGLALLPRSVGQLAIGGVVLREVEGAPTLAHVVAWRSRSLNPALPPFLKITMADTGD